MIKKNNFRFPVTVDSQEFKKSFDKNLPSKSSKVEIGDCYGSFERNRFYICSKKGARSVKILAHDMLRGEVDNTGRVEYRFCRTGESFIFTVLVPIFMFLAGVLLGMWKGIDGMYMWFPIAICLFLCNFIIPKKQRQNLLDELCLLIELSQTSKY